MWVDPWGLLKEGEVAGYGSKLHARDGLEAHEIIRNKYFQISGIGTGRRVKGNPSIALTPEHHDWVHAAENTLRKAMKLGVNDMLSSARLEIKLMSKAIQLSLIDTNIISQQQLRTARRYAKSFAKSKGCY
nr:hypothetical protein [Proteus sp. NMG38-2]